VQRDGQEGPGVRRSVPSGEPEGPWKMNKNFNADGGYIYMGRSELTLLPGVRPDSAR